MDTTSRRVIARLLRSSVILVSAIAAGCSPAGPTQNPDELPPLETASATPMAPKSNPELERAKALVEAGSFAEALPIFEKLSSASPNDAEAAYYVALALENTGKKPEAEAQYKKALGLDKKLSAASENLAALYLDAPPRPDEAIAVLKEAAQHEPGNLRLLQNLAYAYGLKKDVDKASTVYALILKTQDTKDVRLAFGTMLFENKQFDRAVPELKKAVEGQEDPALLATVARMMGHAKSFDDCVSLLDRAIAKKGDVAEFFVRRGLCKHELKKEKEASDDFRAALKVDDKFQAAHYYLGISMIAQKKPNDAKTALKKAYELGKDTSFGKLAKETLDEKKWK